MNRPTMGMGMALVAAAALLSFAAGATQEEYMGFADRQNLRVAMSGALAWTETLKGVTAVCIVPRGGSKIVVQELTGMSCYGLLFEVIGGVEQLVWTCGEIAGANPTHNTAGPRPTATYYGMNATLLMERAITRVVNNYAYYVEGASAYRAPVQQPTAATLLFTVPTGTVDDMAISPKGDRIAFSSNRKDHGFIGVYTFGSNNIEYLSPSTDLDRSPVFSPDGTMVAWLRYRVHPGDYGISPVNDDLGNRGPDYAVMVATLSRSSFAPAVQLFLDTKYGYPTDGYGSRPLMWVGPQSIVFGSEGISGWKHAVLADVGTGAVQELAPGPCEDLAWYSIQDGWVYLVSNCQNIDSRGVERVHVASPGQRQVIVEVDAWSSAGMASSGNGMVAFSDGVAFFMTKYNEAASVHVANTTGGIAISLVAPAVMGTTEWVKPEVVTFSSPPYTIHGQLFTPTGRTAPGPAVVHTHGGSMRQMFACFHYSTAYSQQYAVNQWLASKGYVVFSINYRSGIGYGPAFRLCKNCKAQGAAEYQDVLNGAKWLAKLTTVDKRRIGIWGISYGGLNALQAVTRNSDVFAAAVSGAGIFSWVTQSRFDNQVSTIFEPTIGGFRNLPIGPEADIAGPSWAGTVANNINTFFRSSPAAYLSNFTSPTLIFQGDADQDVAFQETIGLVRAMRTLGRKNVEVLVFPDESHGLGQYPNQVYAMAQMAAFFDAHL